MHRVFHIVMHHYIVLTIIIFKSATSGSKRMVGETLRINYGIGLRAVRLPDQPNGHLAGMVRMHWSEGPDRDRPVDGICGIVEKNGRGISFHDNALFYCGTFQELRNSYGGLCDRLQWQEKAKAGSNGFPWSELTTAPLIHHNHRIVPVCALPFGQLRNRILQGIRKAAKCELAGMFEEAQRVKRKGFPRHMPKFGHFPHDLREAAYAAGEFYRAQSEGTFNIRMDTAYTIVLPRIFSVYRPS